MFHLQGMNLAHLAKCVGRIMSFKDLAIKVLKNNYGMCLDWERLATPVQGASTFWHLQ